MLLLIDNYDSFTYNIVNAFCMLGEKVNVVFNDGACIDECLCMKPKGILIGPGPGSPKDAGISLRLILKASSLKIPVFGICLGMQAIGEAFGATVIRSHRPMHGKISVISHTNEGCFKDLPQSFQATRYHSLIVDEQTLPNNLIVTAKTSDGLIMGLKHTELPVEGVQFHPEAVASEHGLALFNNWLIHHHLT